MCRRDCCKPRSQAPGVAAAALIIGAGILVGKTGHTLAKVAHDVIEVARIAALTTAILVAAIITAWMVTKLLRWWLRHREAHRDQAEQVTHNWRLYFRPVRDEPLCPACDGNGEVLRSDGSGNFEPRACPECRPARLAG
jgi:hypothetical protein